MEFYYIDEKYIKYLRKLEANVSYKKERPYVGIIMEHNNHLYFTPLTSPKEYLEKNKKYKRIHYPIDNGELGYLKLGNSIPIFIQYVKKIYFKNILDLEYKNLLINQYNFIQKNNINIKNKFIKLFNNTYYKDHFLKPICCDFKKLEMAAPLFTKYEKIVSILTNEFGIDQENIKLDISNDNLIIGINDNFIPLDITKDEKLLVQDLLRLSKK